MFMVVLVRGMSMSVFMNVYNVYVLLQSQPSKLPSFLQRSLYFLYWLLNGTIKRDITKRMIIEAPPHKSNWIHLKKKKKLVIEI